MAYRCASKTLIACVWLPRFPIQVERWRRRELRDAPLALLTGGRQPSVVAVSAEAERAGLRLGMALREVLAVAPQVALHPADPHAYAEVAARLLTALEAVSPLVEAREPGTAYLGLEGLLSTRERPGVYRRSEALIAALERVVRPPFHARIGIGRGKFLAWAAARARGEAPGLRRSASGKTRWLTGAPREVLAPLPATLLPVSAEMLGRLEQFELRTLGDLAALPLSAVLAQFGEEGRRAWQLAHGRDDEPLQPRQPPVEVVCKLQFPAPEGALDAVLAATRQLLERALHHPERRGRGVRQLRLEATLEDAPTWSRTITLRQPATLLAPLCFAARTHVERDPPPGAVETLTVALTAFDGALGGQRSLFPAPRRARQARLAAELRQLRTRFGQAPVARILEVEPWSRIPENRFALLDYDP